MQYRVLVFVLSLTVSALFGCGGKEEAAPGNLAAAASASSEREQAAPLAQAASLPAVPEARGADAAAGGNGPPKVVAVSFREPRVHRGVDIEVMPEGLDPDGDLVTFRIEWFLNGEKLTDLDGAVLPGDRFQKGDRIALRIVPFDGKVDGLPFTGQPIVVPNAPPYFVSSPPLQFQAQSYVYEARAEDPDGESLTYRLEESPSGMTIEADTGKVSWPIGQEQAGDHGVRIVAEDEEGMKAVQEYKLTIRIDKQEGH